MVCGLLFRRAWQRKKGDALARAWWAWAAARRPRRLLLDKKCDVPNGCAEASNGVPSYLLAFALCSSMELRPPDWNYPVGLSRCYFTSAAVPVQLVWASFVARSWFCS